MISTINSKMGGGNPAMGAMLAGMMPYIRTKLDELDEKTVIALATIMAQAFSKVSDPAVNEKEFEEWLQFD